MMKREVITMKCPNCGVVYADHCQFCGASLVPPKKGSHWVPILILVGLTLLGLLIFFATGGYVDFLIPAAPGMDNGAFLIHDGSVYVVPDAYLAAEEITVPAAVDGQTVTAIAGYGFAGIEHMTTVNLPDTLEIIGEGAFTNCFSLRSLDVPDSVTIIGAFAFNGCRSLEAIHIPDSVSFIGMQALDDCYNLAHIFYDGTMAEWQVLYFSPTPAVYQVHCSDGTIPAAE